ncbi:MAG: hypothetical protein WBB86_06480, partial [Candidatus Omnitrophota bacterium]
GVVRASGLDQSNIPQFFARFIFPLAAFDRGGLINDPNAGTNKNLFAFWGLVDYLQSHEEYIIRRRGLPEADVRRMVEKFYNDAILAKITATMTPEEKVRWVSDLQGIIELVGLRVTPESRDAQTLAVLLAARDVTGRDIRLTPDRANQVPLGVMRNFMVTRGLRSEQVSGLVPLMKRLLGGPDTPGELDAMFGEITLDYAKKCPEAGYLNYLEERLKEVRAAGDVADEALLFRLVVAEEGILVEQLRLQRMLDALVLLAEARMADGRTIDELNLAELTDAAINGYMERLRQILEGMRGLDGEFLDEFKGHPMYDAFNFLNRRTIPTVIQEGPNAGKRMDITYKRNPDPEHEFETVKAYTVYPGDGSKSKIVYTFRTKTQEYTTEEGNEHEVERHIVYVTNAREDDTVLTKKTHASEAYVVPDAGNWFNAREGRLPDGSWLQERFEEGPDGESRPTWFLQKDADGNEIETNFLWEDADERVDLPNSRIQQEFKNSRNIYIYDGNWRLLEVHYPAGHFKLRGYRDGFIYDQYSNDYPGGAAGKTFMLLTSRGKPVAQVFGATIQNGEVTGGESVIHMGYDLDGTNDLFYSRYVDDPTKLEKAGVDHELAGRTFAYQFEEPYDETKEENKLGRSTVETRGETIDAEGNVSRDRDNYEIVRRIIVGPESTVNGRRVRKVYTWKKTDPSDLVDLSAYVIVYEWTTEQDINEVLRGRIVEVLEGVEFGDPRSRTGMFEIILAGSRAVDYETLIGGSGLLDLLDIRGEPLSGEAFYTLIYWNNKLTGGTPRMDAYHTRLMENFRNLSETTEIETFWKIVRDKVGDVDMGENPGPYISIVFEYAKKVTDGELTWKQALEEIRGQIYRFIREDPIVIDVSEAVRAVDEGRISYAQAYANIKERVNAAVDTKGRKDRLVREMSEILERAERGEISQKEAVLAIEAMITEYLESIVPPRILVRIWNFLGENSYIIVPILLLIAWLLNRFRRREAPVGPVQARALVPAAPLAPPPVTPAEPEDEGEAEEPGPSAPPVPGEEGGMTDEERAALDGREEPGEEPEAEEAEEEPEAEEAEEELEAPEPIMQAEGIPSADIEIPGEIIPWENLPQGIKEHWYEIEAIDYRARELYEVTEGKIAVAREWMEHMCSMGAGFYAAALYECTRGNRELASEVWGGISKDGLDLFNVRERIILYLEGVANQVIEVIDSYQRHIYNLKLDWSGIAERGDITREMVAVTMGRSAEGEHVTSIGEATQAIRRSGNLYHIIQTEEVRERLLHTLAKTWWFGTARCNDPQTREHIEALRIPAADRIAFDEALLAATMDIGAPLLEWLTDALFDINVRGDLTDEQLRRKYEVDVITMGYEALRVLDEIGHYRPEVFRSILARVAERCYAKGEYGLANLQTAVEFLGRYEHSLDLIMSTLRDFMYHDEDNVRRGAVLLFAEMFSRHEERRIDENTSELLKVLKTSRDEVCREYAGIALIKSGVKTDTAFLLGMLDLKIENIFVNISHTEAATGALSNDAISGRIDDGI